jgi:hypothetical protein
VLGQDEPDPISLPFSLADFNKSVALQQRFDFFEAVLALIDKAFVLEAQPLRELDDGLERAASIDGLEFDLLIERWPGVPEFVLSIADMQQPETEIELLNVLIKTDDDARRRDFARILHEQKDKHSADD